MYLDYSVNIGPNDFRTQILSVEELLSMFEANDALNSVLAFRRPTSVQSSRIIESVLLGMPQPVLYVDDSNSEWIVVEGSERLYAYYSFCRNGMKLTSLYFKMQQYEGKMFKDLSPLAKSNILNAKITVNVINPGLSAHERFGVYMCLKSRIDSASLRWCRSKIFPREYQWIKELAKEFALSSNRASSIESVVCYMLVGSYYQSFLGGNVLNHIDAVANRLIQQVYEESLALDIANSFRTVMRVFFDSSKIIRNPKSDGLCLSVLYNLFKKGHRLAKKEVGEICDKTLDLACVSRNDSTETFCRNIATALKYIE